RRAFFDPYSLSRGALSTTQPPLRSARRASKGGILARKRAKRDVKIPRHPSRCRGSSLQVSSSRPTALGGGHRVLPHGALPCRPNDSLRHRRSRFVHRSLSRCAHRLRLLAILPLRLLTLDALVDLLAVHRDLSGSVHA